ncbi:DUF3325 domain-containing protein [Pusillimonas sp. ANT_WB101]|uniref:DUF3325 domain-containing protein n=1 Tax=Pusillimonas sp. ANT_WB101 TaxID=2597356 RepID=UPI0011EE8050|nr:DUF3325 domain-containing protein [Pusillimonas sp. ANT_WB101]KAA0911174.1 DUF3325 domain-containing protein [Pusillimonas sp. ANT_WB101]
MIFAGMMLGFAGFCLLGINMERYQSVVFKKSLANPAHRLLTGLGWLLLVAALMTCMQNLSTSVGLALGIAMLTIPAGLCVLVLNYVPRLMLRAGVLTLAMAALILSKGVSGG